MSLSRRQLEEGYQAADAGDLSRARSCFESVLGTTSVDDASSDDEACRDEALACLARLYRIEHEEIARIDPIGFYRGLHSLLDRYDPHPSAEKAEALQAVAEALADAGQCDSALRVMEGVIDRYGAFLGEEQDGDFCDGPGEDLLPPGASG